MQRKGLLGLFEGLDLRQKPLPAIPIEPSQDIVRRVCMSSTHGLNTTKIDESNKYNDLNCCLLCNAQNWIFQGFEYDPTITILYAKKDGCIPSNIQLTNPKFIIPWRYKNRKTGAISWKIIHQSKKHIRDAENETIIVNIDRDSNLKTWINMAKEHARVYQDADLVEAFLLLIHQALGSYGLPKGASSADADKMLHFQMLKQGHNFMMLGNVKIGLCRHKALLFKILCDYTGLECALVTGYSTGGRHQWNIVTLADKENYIIDPTSPHFTWTKQGSLRTKAYRVSQDVSFGHGGLTMKLQGIL